MLALAETLTLPALVNLTRVSDQVEQHLLQALSIGQHPRLGDGRELERQSLRVGEYLSEVAHLEQDRSDRHRLDHEIRAPGFEAGEIEHVRDELQQMARARDAALQELGTLRGREAALEHRGSGSQ